MSAKPFSREAMVQIDWLEKKYDIELVGLEHHQEWVERCEGLTTQRDQLVTENEHLRALIAKFVFEVGCYRPYARPPANDWLVCIYCESEWELSSQERHADECPIQKGRAAIAAAEGDNDQTVQR